MPYTEEEARQRVRILGMQPDSTVGDLNFAITTILNDYMNAKGLKYQTINDIVGALESSKLEFYRRIAVPYEHDKLIQNGDVYTKNK